MAQIGVREPMPGVVYAPVERLKAYVEAGELPTIGIAEALTDSFRKHAARVAICAPEGDVTYAELDEITDRFGAALLGLGLKPLDRALFQVHNCKELLFAFIGCLKAGLIPICTLAAHREREIGYLGRHADAKLHIVQGDDPKFDLAEFALKMKDEIPTVKHIVALRGGERDGVLSFDKLVEAEAADKARQRIDAIERDAFQVGVFQLSGGTTGVPKIIPRMANDYYFNMKRTVEWLGFTHDDVMFMPMPMIHNACMVCFWGPTLLSGAAFCIPADMTPESWATVFNEKKPTWVGLIRALLPRFETMLEQKLAGAESVRSIWSPDGARIFREKFGRPTYAMFGMTEGLNMYTRMDDPEEIRDWTVGRPLSPMDEVRLVEPGTDREVGLDEPGELTCRGPYTLSGYYNAPERNAQAISKDGFYNSGDLLVKRVIDGRTVYAFAGRTKDVVSRGHEKVSAEEIENAVGTHPAVADCAVVGMPDPVLGERICAYVVTKPGQAVPTVADLAGHLQAFGLAKFKWPERVEQIDALPLTRVGKLDKATLRADIAAKAAEAAAGAG